MPRTKLQMPDQYQFSTQINVRITDLNYANHLANDSLLSLLHEARVRFLDSYGYSEIDIEGVSTMMADAVIIYKSQGFYGDSLTIEIGMGDISKKSCDLYYRITKPDQKVVALCKTAIVFYDFQNQKPVPIPSEFVAKVQDTEISSRQQ